jgi:peroxiredoxin
MVSEQRSSVPGEPPVDDNGNDRPRKRRTRLRRWAFDIALFLGLYLAITTWRERSLLSSGATPAPGFSLDNLEGQPVSLRSLKGKSVLVHFWATWCGVCRQEFGTLDAVQRGLDKNQALIAIVADSGKPDQVRRFVAEHHIHYPVLLGTPAVLRAYHVTVFPTTYFIGPDGKVRGHTIGMSTRWGMSARLGCARR